MILRQCCVYFLYTLCAAHQIHGYSIIVIDDQQNDIRKPATLTTLKSKPSLSELLKGGPGYSCYSDNVTKKRVCFRKEKQPKQKKRSNNLDIDQLIRLLQSAQNTKELRTLAKDLTRAGSLPEFFRRFSRKKKNSESDEDVSSDSKESAEESEDEEAKHFQKKRFSVINKPNKKRKNEGSDSGERNPSPHKKKDNWRESDDSKESLNDKVLSSSSEENQVHKKHDEGKLSFGSKAEKYVYIQGAGRQYRGNYRRRLPYFLPKRYHWEPEEFGSLGYFWFNGPQGKYQGPYKIWRR